MAEGLIASKLQYLMPLWGGATKNLMNKVLVILNEAARTILSKGRRTKSMTPMKE